MNNFKIKLILTVLSSIVFSFIFILLALVLPVENQYVETKKIPKGMLEKVSSAANKKK